MCKLTRKNVKSSFQLALFSLTYSESSRPYAYYYDTIFNDLVKVQVKDGVILTVSTYELTKPIKECLSPCVYGYIYSALADHSVMPYEKIRKALVREGCIQEKETFKIKLKSFNLSFGYYKSSGGMVVSHQDYVNGVSLNSISDEELLGKKEDVHHNTSFYGGIESSYYQNKEQIFEKYDSPDLLVHLIDSMVNIVEVDFNRNLEKTKELLKHPVVNYGVRTVRDEWGNTLYQY